MEDPMTCLRQLLAHNMKERRRVLKMSQYKLAELAETSGYYIGMIENRKKCPSPEMLLRIAAALGIDTPELFSMQSYPAETFKQFRMEILNLIREMTDKVLEDKLRQLKKRR
jgi:transcriptional regulator with XRE-family HTH domain